MFVTRGHLPHQGACPRRATAVAASQRPLSRPNPRVRAVLAARANHDTAPAHSEAEYPEAALTGAKYPHAEIAAEPEPKGFGAPPPVPWPYAGRNLSKMNTYARRAANPCGIRTSKIIGLKASCNEHLQKNGGRGALIVTQRLPPARRRRQANNLAFPVTSALLVRSLAKRRKSTPLFSCACARFCEKVGVARTSLMLRSATNSTIAAGKPR